MWEKRLIARLKAGERGALDRVIEQYTPYISVIVHRILSPALPREDIEETIADVFIELWRRADELHGESLKGYLAAIARTKSLNRLRSAKPPADELPENAPAPLPAPDEQILQGEQSELLRDAVERLGAPDRDIFLRYYYEGQAIGVIADALALSPSAVKSRLLRGRRKLQAEFLERGVTFEELL